jgi:diguanylate cyclase (GGDEF)-like protein
MEEAWALRNGDRAAARTASEAVLANAGADPRSAALAKVVRSYLDYRERHYEQAVAAALEALAVLETNPADPWLPRLYNTLAIIYFDLGERDTSRAYLDRQIRLSHELGDRLYEALGYHDLGLLQAAIDAPRGLATLAQARAMFHADNDAENEALALYNMANIHQHAGERELAAGYAGQALQILRAGGTHGIGGYLAVHIATLMAEAAAALGRHGEAQSLLDEAHALAARHFPELMAHVQFCQGLHLATIGDDAGAIAQFQGTLAQVGASGHYELIADCHAALADCHERLGNYRDALGHCRAYAAARERTFVETSEQKVRALDVMHQIESARWAAEAERQRNAELQRYIQELEQLQARLWAISLRDPLTGLYNRRYLTEEGGRLLSYAQRYQNQLCAAMIDVDHFKYINDELGHQVGDVVLQKLAEIMTQAMRSTDLISRYGGEEIVLLLPATSIESAYMTCERLRALVEQYNWSAIHPKLHVTVSIGLSEDDGSTLADLLARADTQLYASKRTGRNRTSYHQGAATEPASE